MLVLQKVRVLKPRKEQHSLTLSGRPVYQHKPVTEASEQRVMAASTWTLASSSSCDQT